MNDPLFLPDELMQFQAAVKRLSLATAKAPLIMFYGGVQVVLLLTVGLVEWEIIYQVFDYLAGETENGESAGYWKPGLMALSALSVIVGFHLLAKVKPDNVAVRIVEAAVQVLIVLYLFGVGFQIATILYADGLGGMAEVPETFSLGTLGVPVGPGWLDSVFEQIANPMAVLALALGLGGLAVINIFVAHRLLVLLGGNLTDLVGRVSRLRAALKDHAIIRQTQRDYAQLGVEIETLDGRDDTQLRLSIASRVIAVIAEALLPHKVWLSEHAHSGQSRFEADEPVDPKQLAKDIARIEAISLEDVLAALSPKCLEKK